MLAFCAHATADEQNRKDKKLSFQRSQPDKLKPSLRQLNENC
jgi:hypothetical protein